MSYNTEKDKLGRKPVTMCGIVADFCQNTYSQPPCEANTFPWSLDNAGYAELSLDVSDEETSITGVTLNAAGEDAFIVGTNTATIYQYRMSVDNDISTGLYDGAETESLTSTTKSAFLTADGKYLFSTLEGGSVFRRTLDNEHYFPGSDLQTINDLDDKVNEEEDVDSPTTTAFDGIAFNSNGRSAFLLGLGTTHTIWSVSLATPWDLDTAVYSQGDFYNDDGDNLTPGVSTHFSANADLTKVLWVDMSTGIIHQFSTSGGSISNASASATFDPVADLPNKAVHASYNSDETVLYVIGDADNELASYNISNGDISTAVLITSISIASQSYSGAVISNSGKHIYLISTSTAYHSYMYTADDLTTRYTENKLSVSVQDSLPVDLFIANDGDDIYVLGSISNTVYQYSFSVVGETASLSYSGKSFSVNTQDTLPTAIYINEAGDKWYMLGSTNDAVFQYSMTDGDISTSSYSSKSADVSSEETGLTGLGFGNGDELMYVIGIINQTTYQYDLSTAGDVNTATYSTKSLDMSTEDALPGGLFFQQTGLDFYMAGNANDTIYQYRNSYDNGLMGFNSPDACYNTRSTCQDVVNYRKGSKEYVHSQARDNLPIGEVIFPTISGNVEKAPTSTTAGTGLGKRAVVKVKFKDFAHHDRGIDPYTANRTYDTSQGTFWGKWLARNTYYEGRTLKVYHGYLGDTFSWSDFEIQEYDITEIKRDKKNIVSLTAKDALIRTYADEAEYPQASDGVLSADITDSATSADLSPVGIGDSDYPLSGYISIADEAIYYTRSSDVLTLVRGQWGTTAVAHTASDIVQIAPAWNAAATDNVLDMLEELLVTGAGMPSSYIPSLEWGIQKGLWMSGSLVKGILMKPEPIEDIIEELSEVFMFDIWWDAVVQEIKVKALSPEIGSDTVNTFSDGAHIIQESLKIDKNPEDRFTDIQVYFNKIDYSGDDKEGNFRNRQIAADATRAGEDLYNGNTTKTMFSRWFDSAASALQLTGRTLKRFSDTPEYVTFRLDNKDHSKLELAGRVELDSWQFQDETGATTAKKFQVLEIKEIDAGHQIEVKCLTSTFSGRYGFVTVDSMVDYTSATDEQKLSNGFISEADGTFSNGDESYKII